MFFNSYVIIFLEGDEKMICKCGGMLFVKRVEEYPQELKLQEKINYNRVCDVECVKCGKTHYSQPFDFGNTLNEYRKLD